MRLFIAEKPSMAAEIAKCLGPCSKSNGFYLAGTDKVTWLYGHILGMYEPEDYDETLKIWKEKCLPIVPIKWKNKVSKNCEKQYKIVKDLIEEAAEIVHAGDPDREGQLLVDEVLEYVQNRKPVKRILLNALDEKSIQRALTSLVDNKKFRSLKTSAELRQKSDWLTGMNYSRAFTLAARKRGHKDVFPVGRVKTPTLALVVRREEEILNFTPVKYYKIIGLFKTRHSVDEKQETFQMQWKATCDKGLDTEGRLVDVIVMREILDRLNSGDRVGQVVKYEIMPKVERPCKVFSLSTLQIAAGKKYGYEPQKVLDICQALYEKKLTTYPRSDCEFLPESQRNDGKTILHNLKLTGNEELTLFAGAADPALQSPAWNDKKITAHHALIPTSVPCDFEKLSEDERNIYFLIGRTYIAQFMPDHHYNQTKIEVDCSEQRFTVSGKTITSSKDWKILFKKDIDKENKDDEERTLPQLKEGEKLDLLRANSDEKMTKPPQRFSPATLVQAMKDIHKYVRNEELKKTLKDVTGIGTEATRAGIIDELIQKGFLMKEKKNVTPSEKAKLLISILPDELTYPDFTAVMENRLNMLVSGTAEEKSILDDQIKELQRICTTAKNVAMEKAAGTMECSVCQKGILVQKKGPKGVFWGCTNYPECRTTYRDNDGKPDLIPRNRPQEQDCPQCKKGKLFFNKKFSFWGCSEYRNGCRASFSDSDGKPAIHRCACGGFLRKMTGKRGDFWKCKQCEKTFNDQQGTPELR